MSCDLGSRTNGTRQIIVSLSRCWYREACGYISNAIWDFAGLLERWIDVLLSDRVTVLDVYAGGSSFHPLLPLGLKFLARHVMIDIDFLAIQDNSIGSVDDSLGVLNRLVVNEAMSLGPALIIGTDLAEQYVPKAGECIMESLLVDLFIKIADIEFTLSDLAQSGVRLGPRDMARTALDSTVVKFESALGIYRILVIDVSPA